MSTWDLKMKQVCKLQCSAVSSCVAFAHDADLGASSTDPGDLNPPVLCRFDVTSGWHFEPAADVVISARTNSKRGAKAEQQPDGVVAEGD